MLIAREIDKILQEMNLQFKKWKSYNMRINKISIGVLCYRNETWQTRTIRLVQSEKVKYRFLLQLQRYRKKKRKKKVETT